jgi:probable F420-dependent oxidoreductase
MSEAPFLGVRPAGWLAEDPAEQAKRLLDFAELADRLAFDVLYVGDRLLATAGNDDLAVYDAPMLEPFVLLAAMAARTTRIRLATLVAVVPFRHPASLAKLTASLDVISNGRFVCGAGSGWSAGELRMFGVDARKRGRQMEEGIETVRRLWRGETVSLEGEFWQLEDVRVLPRPVQDPGPPVWLASFAPDDAVVWSGDFSGGQLRALERIGRIADGWVPLTYSAGHKRQLSPQQFADGWNVIESSAEAAGRDPASIDRIYAHWIEIVDDEADRRACEAGLARFFPGTYEDGRATYLIGTAEEIAERVREHVALLDRVDGYLFTSISERPDQLERIAAQLRPLIEAK